MLFSYDCIIIWEVRMIGFIRFLLGHFWSLVRLV